MQDWLRLATSICKTQYEGKIVGVQMSEAVGITISPTPESTLSDMIELGLTKHITKLEEIGVTASREFALEQSLRKMKQEWVDINFELVPYRCSSTLALYSMTINVKAVK